MEVKEIHEHRKHEKHRNILYAAVVILLIIQTITFISISSQFAKFDSSMENIKKDFSQQLQSTSKEFQRLLETYDAQYQKNFNDIVKALEVQQVSFDKEIQTLKAGREDFSGIIEDSVKGVVSVGTEKSSGTGFIVNENGYVVTNAHVVLDARKIAVLTYDRKIIPAELIGQDKLRDLALLKIEGEHHALKLEDSDNLEVGRKVIAIGNPLGLSFTVTQGIISALDRTGPNGLAEYVQTDVSLNPGNSGGPLIDIQGKVVGINNFKVGNAEGLGFALESNSIRKTVNIMVNQTIIE